ncbi:MAG: rRNA pseudouridine synthase [Clostridia bacterium]|nr:rRNA pseudouridine synthase [Clostridia bacterium]
MAFIVYRGESYNVGDIVRLDKYLSGAAVCSRSEAAKAAKRGRITVDGAIVRDAAVHIDENGARVTFDGREVVWRRFDYIMLNKPAGYISSTEDSGRTVMDLLPPECQKKKMFPCGRLDIDTTGLLLITNDGDCAHKLLSPARHVKKTYAFRCDPPIGENERRALEAGVDLGEFVSAPAEVTLADDGCGTISITEGKFHQIKRMFQAVGSKIVELERVSFGPLTLDASLGRGEFRELTPDEERAITEYDNQ